MSQLQEKAIPLLSSLIKDENIVISARDARMLAAWVAMATMVLEFDDRNTVVIAESERHWLKSLQLPPPTRWMIFAGRVNASLENEWYCHLPSCVLSTDNTVEITPVQTYPLNFQKSFLSLGNMVVVAFSATTNAANSASPFFDGPAKFAQRQGFTQLWPPTGRSTGWHSIPKRETADIEILAYKDMLKILQQRHEGVLRIITKPARTPLSSNSNDLD